MAIYSSTPPEPLRSSRQLYSVRRSTGKVDPLLDPVRRVLEHAPTCSCSLSLVWKLQAPPESLHAGLAAPSYAVGMLLCPRTPAVRRRVSFCLLSPSFRGQSFAAHSQSVAVLVGRHFAQSSVAALGCASSPSPHLPMVLL